MKTKIIQLTEIGLEIFIGGGLKSIVNDKSNWNMDILTLLFKYTVIHASAQLMYSAFTNMRLNLIARFGIETRFYPKTRIVLRRVVGSF